ncbi:sialidase family protein [Pedococcus sp.]|uniref:sialidase family protein n=1 Tax=Pedococcus sp. TaxID=2860345 RepID=UPI002E120F18|nr:sialidase family protein [Pedococcus sp.]
MFRSAVSTPLVLSVAASGLIGAALTVPAIAAPAHTTTHARTLRKTTTTTPNAFASGQPQAQSVGAAGCGTNTAGEPSIHVSRSNLVGLGSEDGVGSGSEFWRSTQVGGTTAASPCGLTYSGQPNAVSHIGAAGGDVDTAFAPALSTAGTHRIYLASLNLGSVNVATSNDDGKTFSQIPVQAGLPVDDREWIAAYGADTSLLTFHDVATSNIDVLRSDTGGGPYTQIAQAIPATDYKATNNELGNLVIDHDNPSTGGFWAYQAFVAPSADPGATSSAPYNEAFLAVSPDGGHTWTDKPIPCSTAFGAKGLNHNFPNVSVAPNGTLFYAVSNDTSVYVASSTNHGDTWNCSGPVSTAPRAIFPWLVATSAGEDLVYYGETGTGATATWHVYFAQNLTQSLTGWSTTQLMPVHTGDVCEGGVTCTGGRQLLDDFGVDTDQSGWAHIAYSHDSPDLGGSGSYTGYAVQTAGTPVGRPN